MTAACTVQSTVMNACDEFERHGCRDIRNHPEEDAQFQRKVANLEAGMLARIGKTLHEAHVCAHTCLDVAMHV